MDVVDGFPSSSQASSSKAIVIHQLFDTNNKELLIVSTVNPGHVPLN